MEGLRRRVGACGAQLTWVAGATGPRVRALEPATTCRPAGALFHRRQGLDQKLDYSRFLRKSRLMENRSVTAPSAAAPTRDKLTAAEALLEQKRRAAADYQEGRRNQAGTGTQTAGTGTTTPASGGTPAQGQQKENEPNRLSDIIGLLGDTIVGGDRRSDRPATSSEEPSRGGAEPSDVTKDQSFLLRAARQATERGAHQEANALLRSLAALFPERTQTVADNPERRYEEAPTKATAQPEQANPIIASQPSQTVETAVENPIQREGAVSFIVGEIPTHSYHGLPAFYDKNVKALKGSIPLTIFDPLWQQQAAAHHTERRNVERTSTDERRYTGLPAPGEWSQSYAQWSRNYQSFVAALRDLYQMPTISGWFQTHREKVDDLMRRRGFCAGFRYDLAVRANAFQCDMIRRDASVFPDVSKWRDEIKVDVISETQQRGEVQYIDNPYIVGGPKEFFDPHTGIEKPAQAKKTNSDTRPKGQNPPGRGGRGRWESYPQGGGRDEDRQRGGGDGTRYRDYRDDQRDHRDNRDGQRGLQDHSDKPTNRVRGYKAQQGASKEIQRGQGKPM
ncbi:hypothetical protein PCASD_14551 [Puccinia coronata f. sp. avenae]|uniref:Uncharacterized protein n=1 Tax=Puccinia coronata f. sp. avenae TaxID=200324 RepID=A0A2N5STS4_9BASI|nr:hypothetical protein PCASD_14551 [Puccinia coronata f. sp. avenae]